MTRELEISYWRKVALPVAGLSLLVLGLFYLFFGAFQHERIYYKTAGRFLINCEWNAEEGYKDLGNRSFAPMKGNLTNWDANFYNVIRTQGYHSEAPGVERESLVPFFPLWPVVWKLSFLPPGGAIFLTWLMFTVGILLLGSVLLDKLPRDQSIIIMGLCLILPTSVVFHMPYSEAASFLAFGAATWAWFKRKPVLCYVFLLLFSLSRPVSGILGLAFISTAVYFTILGKANVKLWLQTGIAVAVLVAGPLLYFAFHYTYYDNFWIFFKMQAKWGSHFRLPEQFNDWSFEALSMSLFGCFGLVIPFATGIAVRFFKAVKGRGRATQMDLFQASREDQTELLAVLALAFSLGLTLFTILFQGGSLHSYSRYLLAGPFGLILLFIGASRIHDPAWWKRLLVCVVPVTFALVFWNQLAYHWRWDFRDSGFFLMLALLLIWMFYDKLPRWVSWSGIAGVGLLCIVYQTHLYNLWLMECWFFL